MNEAEKEKSADAGTSAARVQDAERNENMQTKYSTKSRKKGRAAMIIALAALIGMIALNLFAEPGIKPDVEYPMCNQRIEWNGR